MVSNVILLLAALGLTVAQKTPGGIIHSSFDPSSFGNIDVIQTKHLELNLTADFSNSSLYGMNTLTMKAIQDTSEVILDF